MIALFFFTWLYIVSTTNWELWLYVWVNLSKNVTPLLQKLQGSFVLNFPFISIFDFKAINYCTESKNVIHIFFFFKDLSIFIYPYTEHLYSASQNTGYHTLCIFMIYIVYKKWPRSSKPFSWKWNWSYCYVPRRDINVR